MPTSHTQTPLGRGVRESHVSKTFLTPRKCCVKNVFDAALSRRQKNVLDTATYQSPNTLAMRRWRSVQKWISRNRFKESRPAIIFDAPNAQQRPQGFLATGRRVARKPGCGAGPSGSPLRTWEDTHIPRPFRHTIQENWKHAYPGHAAYVE